MGLSKTAEKDYARILYTSERMTQKEVSERVKVSEKTISRWVQQGNWDQLRKSMLVTKQHQISLLYDQLAFLNDSIADREYKIATAKEADVISKLTSSIQRLEVETSVGQIIEVARSFIDFVREEDLSLAKDVTIRFDAFIQSKMK